MTSKAFKDAVHYANEQMLQRGQKTSIHVYRESMEVTKHGFSFEALIMAAIRKADFHNTRKLKVAWPDVYAELYKRHSSPGGFIEGEDDGGE